MEALGSLEMVENDDLELPYKSWRMNLKEEEEPWKSLALGFEGEEEMKRKGDEGKCSPKLT